jgi:hypothetical protein
MSISRMLCVAIVIASAASSARAQEKTEYLLKKEQTNKRDSAQPMCPCTDAAAAEVAATEAAAVEAAATAAKAETAKKRSPWTLRLRFGSVFQISQSKSVVGKLDGTSRSFQTDIHGEANWRCGRHEVRNRLDTNDVIVKTQNTGRWVPASDFVEAESIYQYHWLPAFGPFARAGLRTSVFLGRDLRTNAVRYELPEMMLTGERTEYRLTDRFLPLTLLQSAGAFYNPVREKHFDVDFRGGFGVREVLADDQLGVKDDADTKDIVELVGLHSYVEAGIETVVMVRAELFDEHVSTYAGIETLVPLLRSKEPGDMRTTVDLISETVQLGVAYKLAKSATIVYELRLVHNPQLIEAVQIQNNAGFKATFNLL